MNLKELRGAVNAALESFERAFEDLQNPQEGADVEVLERKFNEAEAAHQKAVARLEQAEAVEEARKNAPIDPVEASSGEAETETREERPNETETRNHARPKSNSDVTHIDGSPLVYNRENQHTTSFVRDLVGMKTNPLAAERVMAHQRQMIEKFGEESRTNPNQAAGQGGEFIPPLWLTGDWIRLAKAGRVTADACRQVPLPPGTNSINFPQVSTGATTATQSDAGSVSSTDMTTTSYSIAVRTIAGQQDISRQLLDLSVPGFDTVVFEELHGRYAINVDTQVLSGSGSAPNLQGLHGLSGINTVTYTQSTPAFGGAGGFYAKLNNAIELIHTTRYLAPNLIVMHPVRWAWVLASADSNNRVQVTPGEPGFNVPGSLSNVAPEGIVGRLAGLPVAVDPNITTTAGAGTNQDYVYVLRTDDLWLFEDSPVRTRVLDEVLSGTLQVRMQLFNYLTFGVRYPKSVCEISGTGLAAPSF